MKLMMRESRRTLAINDRELVFWGALLFAALLFLQVEFGGVKPVPPVPAVTSVRNGFMSRFVVFAEAAPASYPSNTSTHTFSLSLSESFPTMSTTPSWTNTFGTLSETEELSMTMTTSVTDSGRSFSLSRTISPSATVSLSESWESLTVSGSEEPTMSLSLDESFSRSLTTTTSIDVSISDTLLATETGSVPTDTMTISFETLSVSATESDDSATPSSSEELSATASRTLTVSASETIQKVSSTETLTTTLSETQSISVSDTLVATETDTISGQSETLSETIASETLSTSESLTETITTTGSSSLVLSASETGESATFTASLTVTPSFSESLSDSGDTMSFSRSVSPVTLTYQKSPSRTFSRTPATFSSTLRQSVSVSPSFESFTATVLSTKTDSVVLTDTASMLLTVSETEGTETISFTSSMSFSPSDSLILTGTPSVSESEEPSMSQTLSVTGSNTVPLSESPAQESSTQTISWSETVSALSGTASRSPATRTGSTTLSSTATSTLSGWTETDTVVPTLSETHTKGTASSSASFGTRTTTISPPPTPTNTLEDTESDTLSQTNSPLSSKTETKASESATVHKNTRTRTDTSTRSHSIATGSSSRSMTFTESDETDTQSGSATVTDTATVLLTQSHTVTETSTIQDSVSIPLSSTFTVSMSLSRPTLSLSEEPTASQTLSIGTKSRSGMSVSRTGSAREVSLSESGTLPTISRTPSLVTASLSGLTSTLSVTNSPEELSGTTSLSVSETLSTSRSRSITISIPLTVSAPKTPTGTFSVTETFTKIPTVSSSLSPTVSFSFTPTETETKSGATVSDSYPTPSETRTVTVSRTPPISATHSWSEEISMSFTTSLSETTTLTVTASLSDSVSAPTLSFSDPTVTASGNTHTRSFSEELTVSTTWSAVDTLSRTHSALATLTPSDSLSDTHSLSASLYPTLSGSSSHAVTISAVGKSASKSYTSSGSSSFSEELSSTMTKSIGTPSTTLTESSTQTPGTRSETLSPRTITTTLSFSELVSDTLSLGSTASVSLPLSLSLSLPKTPSRSQSEELSMTYSGSFPSGTISLSPSESALTETLSMTDTESVSQSLSITVPVTTTSTFSITESVSSTLSASTSVTKEISLTQTIGTPTPTDTLTILATESNTVSLPTVTSSETFTGTLEVSPTLSVVLTESDTIATPTGSSTLSMTSSFYSWTPTASIETPSATKSPSRGSGTVSLSEELSMTVTASATQSNIRTLTETESKSLSDSLSEEVSMSWSPSTTFSLTPTISRMSPSYSVSDSLSATITDSVTLSLTLTPSVSRSPSIATYTKSETGPTPSYSPTESDTIILTPTESLEPTMTESLAETVTETLSSTATVSVTFTSSLTKSFTFGTSSKSFSGDSNTISMTDSGYAQFKSKSKSITITPPPTFSVTFTDSTSSTLSLSSEVTMTVGTFSTSLTETASHSAPTPSDTLSERSDTISLSRETVSSSHSFTPDFTMTFTETGDSLTLSSTESDLSMSRSFSLSDTQSESITPPDTPSVSYSLTQSKSLEETLSRFTASWSEEESMSGTLSGTMTEEATFSEQPTDSESLTTSHSYPTPSLSISKDTLKPQEAHFSIVEQPLVPYTVIHPVKYTRHIQLHYVPLIPEKDTAALLLADQECYNETTKTVNEDMIELTLLTRIHKENVWSNWSVVVDVPGIYKVCYYNSFTDRWHNISSPSNITFAAYAVPDTLTVQGSLVGLYIDTWSTVYGGNSSQDEIRFIPWGEDCNSIGITFAVHVPIYAYGDDILSIKSINEITWARDYTMCYLGFPHIRPTTLFSRPTVLGWQQLNRGPVRMHANPLLFNVEYGAPLRVYRPFGLRIHGHGLSVLDDVRLTNDTTARCTDLLPSEDRVVTQVILRRYYESLNELIHGRTTVEGEAMLVQRGLHYLCYRGNTSRVFTEVGTMLMEPIVASYFTPNATTENLLYPNWAVGAEVLLALHSDPAISNTLDAVTFHNDTTGCPEEGLVQTLDPYLGQYGNATNEWIGVPRVPGNFSVCYWNNASITRSQVGVIEVKPQFYIRPPNSDLNRLFTHGAQLNAEFYFTPAGVTLRPLSDKVYVTRKNFTAGSTTCYSEVPPNATSFLPTRLIAVNNTQNTTTNVTFAFEAANRGFYVFCYVTPMGNVLESEVFVIHPDPPKGFYPPMIGLNTTTNITFGASPELDFMDGDTVSLCGPSVPTSTVRYSSVRVASFNVSEVGTYSVCFTSGVVVAGQTVPLTWVIGSLTVAPILHEIILQPPADTVQKQFDITLQGEGLAMGDVLYVCDSRNESAVAALPSMFNSTAATFLQDSPTKWRATFTSAADRPLCYWYGDRKPSFPPHPTNVSIIADPLMLTGYPLSITASTDVAINFTGIDLFQLSRVFLRGNGASSCGDPSSPFDVDMEPAERSTSGNTSTRMYVVNIGHRGTYLLCYQGLSSRAYEIASQTRLTVAPRLDNFTADQDTVEGATLADKYFYSGYPIVVDLYGGGLRYADDSFWAVAGTTCDDDPVKEPLSSVHPPLHSVSTMQLTWIPAYSGDWMLCYRFGGSTETKGFPFNVMKVQDSLIYVNGSLIARGPAVSPDALYVYSFTATGYYTKFQGATSSTTIAVPYVPMTTATYRCQVFAPNGNVLYNLTTVITIPPDQTLCGRFPQGIADPDSEREFAMSLVAMYNYARLECWDVLEENALYDASQLLRSMLELIGSEQALVVDVEFTFLALANAIINAKQPLAETYEETELLLTGTSSTLERDDYLITHPLITAHVKVIDTAAAVLRQQLDSNTDPATAQAIGIKMLDQLATVAGRYCASPLSAHSLNESTPDLSVVLLHQSVSQSRSLEFKAGFGVTSESSFSALSSVKKCVQSTLFSSNFMPTRPAMITSGRMTEEHQHQQDLALRRPMNVQQQQEVSARTAAVGGGTLATPVEFNMPVLLFQLPNGDGKSPLADVDKLQWSVPFERVTRPPGVFGHGVVVEAEFYRFVRDSKYPESAGEWVLDIFTVAEADEDTGIMTITHNHTAAVTNAVLPPKEVMISGHFTIDPIMYSPPDRENDYWLVIFMGCLAVLHFLLVGLGKCIDISRDGDHSPNEGVINAKQSLLTFHRYASVFSRKPHQFVSTSRRITVCFTYIFAACLFTILSVEYYPWEHSNYYNGLYAVGVALMASPPAALTRVLLHIQLRDYASFVGAAFSLTAIAFSASFGGLFLPAVVGPAVGIVFFGITVAISRSDWSYETRGKPGIAPKIWGILFHLTVEGVALTYVIYVALVPGVPIPVKRDFDFYQVLGWAVVIDLLVFEPFKNKGIFVLRGFVEDFDRGKKKAEKDAAEKAARGTGVAAAVPHRLEAPTARARSGPADLEEYIDDEEGADEEGYNSLDSSYVEVPPSDAGDDDDDKYYDELSPSEAGTAKYAVDDEDDLSSLEEDYVSVVPSVESKRPSFRRRASSSSSVPSSPTVRITPTSPTAAGVSSPALPSPNERFEELDDDMFYEDIGDDVSDYYDDVSVVREDFEVPFGGDGGRYAPSVTNRAALPFGHESTLSPPPPATSRNTGSFPTATAHNRPPPPTATYSDPYGLPAVSSPTAAPFGNTTARSSLSPQQRRSQPRRQPQGHNPLEDIYDEY